MKRCFCSKPNKPAKGETRGPLNPNYLVELKTNSSKYDERLLSN